MILAKLAFVAGLADMQMSEANLEPAQWETYRDLQHKAYYALSNWPGKTLKPKQVEKLRKRIAKFAKAMQWDKPIGIQAAINFCVIQALSTLRVVKDEGRRKMLNDLLDAEQAVFMLYSDDAEEVDYDAVDEGDLAFRTWSNIVEAP